MEHGKNQANGIYPSEKNHKKSSRQCSRGEECLWRGAVSETGRQTETLILVIACEPKLPYTKRVETFKPSALAAPTL